MLTRRGEGFLAISAAMVPGAIIAKLIAAVLAPCSMVLSSWGVSSSINLLREMMSWISSRAASSIASCSFCLSSSVC